MISNTTITSFLNRELDEFDWVKELDAQSIDAALSELVSCDLTKSLWLHQKASLLVMLHQPRFMLHLPMGSGKTNLVLTMLRHRKLLWGGAQNQTTLAPRTIVLVPFVTATDTWVEEVTKFAPELSCCPLLGSSTDNLNILQSTNHDVYVMCYQSAVAMCTLKTSKKWVLDGELIRHLQCDMLILDEVQKTKSIQSLTFKMCRSIASRAEYVYGLTGTPMGKDLQDLWAQFYLIDFGETLGTTLSFYRAVFFSKKAKFWGGVEFKFKQRLMPKLQRMIKNRSIRYAISDYSDIPEKQYIQRHIRLHESLHGYVDKAKGELHKAVIDENLELAGNAYLQLRQLSSGFITFKGDDERIKVKFDDNPKLDVLIELIEAMPSDCKMVIFHEYRFSNEMIRSKLTELKIPHAHIVGGQRDQITQLTKFRTDPNCRILAINIKSGSSSLNLQFANYLVFFEQPTSAIDRQQAEARVWRSGQQKHVMIYDLFVQGTYDQRDFEANKAGENLLQRLLDNKGV